MTGDVCPSSGIEGTVTPRDLDEDGVALDCRAEAQVAFPPTEEYVYPTLQGVTCRWNAIGIDPNEL